MISEYRMDAITAAGSQTHIASTWNNLVNLELLYLNPLASRTLVYQFAY